MTPPRVTRSAMLLAVLAGCASPRTQALGTDSADVAGATVVVAQPMLALERGPCHGTCPVYGVQLFADGRVRFTGTRFVKPVGTDSARVDAARVASLHAAFAERKFGTLPSTIEYGAKACGQYVADLSTVVLTMRHESGSHTVRYDEGCRDHPMMLDTLARMVDSISGTAQWTTPTRP